MAEEPLLAEALPGWRLFRELAWRVRPPVPLPPLGELSRLEEAYASRPFGEFVQALRGWALARGHTEPPLPVARRRANGGVVLEAKAFRPYPFVLGLREGRPAFFLVHGRTRRHSLWLTPGRVRYGRTKGVPVPFLSRVDGIYGPVVLPAYGLSLPGGLLGEVMGRLWAGA
ncbi:hypothetical protein [Thermus scotoductus]|uniref:Uncharacterized protein n=1 Tax=Thermus scotoductus TaxID=37636 RepID=A0A430RCU4_THESC|nr:hypothetical protein [Thermus scotoductus]RTG96930.1 hypothetical protein CSW49_03940 [Thermus scotoductus]RTH05203.1 hypothetical protein CSW45_03810 [Thermus scotoductus]RTH22138.1 hypothetical protein CSW42_03275 [Thermus scotoductus]RTI01799.1 hypothetical protein CSW28_02990 [Thermus scotoductus]RTI23731.1 hypothetical protein CSW21_03970 [Thermus scotoductus]